LMESGRADALAAPARAMGRPPFGIPYIRDRKDVPHLSESLTIRIEGG
jgi:hypothetical protein